MPGVLPIGITPAVHGGTVASKPLHGEVGNGTWDSDLENRQDFQGKAAALWRQPRPGAVGFGWWKGRIPQHGKSTGICLTMGRNNIHYFCDNSIHERPAFQGILSSEASPEEYGVRVKDFVLGAAWGPVGVGVGTGTVPGSSQDRQTPEEPREIPPNLS